MSGKVNDSGYIPRPALTKFKGEMVYYREVSEKDLMKIYQGFGISVSILSELHSIPFLFYYRGVKNHLYMSHIREFKRSKKLRLNNQNDLQAFVSKNDMTELELKGGY